LVDVSLIKKIACLAQAKSFPAVTQYRQDEFLGNEQQQMSGNLSSRPMCNAIVESGSWDAIIYQTSN